MASVLGIFKLRRKDTGLRYNYRTSVVNPVIFCSFSGLVILRGVITDPFQAVAIGLLVAVGLVIFKWKIAG